MAIKVKDNFKFFLSHRSPWGSLGNLGEAQTQPRQVSGVPTNCTHSRGDWAWGWAQTLALTPGACGALRLCASPHPSRKVSATRRTWGLKGAGAMGWAQCLVHCVEGRSC